MKLYVDLETLQLIEAPGFRNPVTSLQFKRGDSATLDVVFLSNGGTVYQTIGDAGTLAIEFGAKMSGNYGGEYLVQSSDWVFGDPDSSYPVYQTSPSFNTTALDAAFGVGTGEELASVTLMGEISWTNGGEPTSTRTFAIVVANDVNRGTEGTPLAADSPDEWLESRRPAPILRTLSDGPPVDGVMASATVLFESQFNAILYTAVDDGAAGNDISVTYVSPSPNSEILVLVSGNSIVVVPVANDRYLIAGTTLGDVYVRYAGVTIDGVTVYSSDGDMALTGSNRTYLTYDGSMWLLCGHYSSFGVEFDGTIHSSVTSPDAITGSWSTSLGAGTPNIIAETSSAADVIAAINASPAASALVVASAVGIVTGSIADVSETHLSGGAGTAGSTGQECYVNLSNIYVCVRQHPVKWVPVPPRATTARTDAAQTFAGVQTFTSPPVFSAIPRALVYKSGADQVITAGVSYVKLLFQSKEYDTCSNYNTSTSTFTMPYAGFLRVTCSVYISAGSTGIDEMSVMVGGVAVRRPVHGAWASGSIINFSTLLYCAASAQVTIGYFAQPSTPKTITAGSAITFASFEVLP